MVLFYPLFFKFCLSYSFIQYLPTTLQYLGCHDCRTIFRPKNHWPPLGATSAIFDLIVGFAVGVGNGMGIIIARNYGAKNEDQLRKSVAATAIIGCILQSLRDLHWSCRTFSCSNFLGPHQQLCLSLISISLPLLMVWL